MFGTGLSELLILAGFVWILFWGGVALRHLRRVARPSEPHEAQPPLGRLVADAFGLTLVFGILALGLRLLSWVVSAPLLSKLPESANNAINSVLVAVILMALSIPVFVAATESALRLEPAVGALNLVKATRVALSHPTFFLYWLWCWGVWGLLAGLRYAANAWLPDPSFLQSAAGPVISIAIDLALRSLGLWATAHFLGLWARRGLHESAPATAGEDLAV